MLNIQTLPNKIKSNPQQLINYYAVAIAELLNSAPTQQHITAIERVLKNYRQLSK